MEKKTDRHLEHSTDRESNNKHNCDDDNNNTIATRMATSHGCTFSCPPFF
jgi:hypothetical protein